MALRPTAPGVAIISLGIFAFIFLVEISFFLRIAGELRDLIFYVIGSLLLAPICAGLRIFILRLGKGAAVEATQIWTAIMALSLFAILPLFFVSLWWRRTAAFQDRPITDRRDLQRCHSDCHSEFSSALSIPAL